MSFDANQPFNDLPLLPPGVQLETVPVLKQAIAASRELAELKGAGNLLSLIHISEPTRRLLIAPLISL